MKILFFLLTLLAGVRQGYANDGVPISLQGSISENYQFPIELRPQEVENKEYPRLNTRKITYAAKTRFFLPNELTVLGIADTLRQIDAWAKDFCKTTKARNELWHFIAPSSIKITYDESHVTWIDFTLDCFEDL